MRILFAGEAERAAWHAKIDAFHSAVQAELARGTPSCSRDVARLELALTRRLGELDPALRVEVHADAAGGLEAVVLPEGPGLECVAVEVVARAPAAAGFGFRRFGDMRALEGALDDVRRRAGVDLATARARVGFSRGHLMEVVVFSPAFSSANDERALDAADLLVARLLGESVYDRWIGAVDIAPLPRGGPLRVVTDVAAPPTSMALAELEPSVTTAIGKVRASLPLERCHEQDHRADWTLLELEAIPDDDYAAADDLILLGTRLPEALKCFLQGSRFASERFNRFGERLLYVKLDGSSLGAEERQALREAVEEVLDLALRAAVAGAVVGAGTGLRYVYVFVATSELADGVRTMTDALRRQRVPVRSWILFCDAGWEDEWVGGWESTEAPFR